MRLSVLCVGFVALHLASAEFVATDVGLSGVDGALHCFGDMNGDKRTDAFVVMNDSVTLRVYMWNDGAYRRTGASLTEELPISSVVAGDFNLDGHLDVLITGKNETSQGYYLHIWLGALYSFGTKVVLEQSVEQVLVFDYNGDRRLDLYGERLSDSKRSVWVNQAGGVAGLSFQTQEHVLPPEAAPKLHYPHSNAFVDFDGDCLPDLFVSAERNGQVVFEIWITQQTSTGFQFALHSSYAAPTGVGQVSFADFDGDGSIDVAFPVCNPYPTCTQDNSIHILYNQQKRMCSSRFASTSSDCRAQDDLCSRDPAFTFSSTWSSSTGDGAHVVIPAQAFGSYTFAAGNDLPPVTLRVGDTNMDGFPDLLISVNSGGRAGLTASTRVTFWQNVPCSRYCSSGRREFAYSPSQGLESLPAAYAGTFVDLDDDGTLDCLVLVRDLAALTTNTYAFGNEFYDDAYFMTALVSNGVCPAWCSSGPKFPSPKPYGVNHVGNSVKFTVTDLSGNKHPRQGSQLPTSAYLPLHTPYLYFGLGRTYNYIEEFYVSIPIPTQHWNSWVALLPNSQVIAFPYPPDDPSAWSLELFVNPAGKLTLVSVSLGVMLLLLGVAIIKLHWREKQEDEKENQREHLFAF